MRPIDLSSIRKQNLRKILDLLTLSPAMTRQELAESAGLSLMTVTNLVDLLKERHVLEFNQAARESTSRRLLGRKAEFITLSDDHAAWLVADISATQLHLSLMGFGMQPLWSLHDNQSGAYLERLERFLQQAREQLSPALDGRVLLGVAIITPGPYDISSDTASNQRIPELNGVHIKALFQQYLGDYDYYVDEDVKFAVRAFSTLIEQNQCEVLYYLFIGEGVGGAAVHRGDMMRGLNATAGDAGQLYDSTGQPYEARLCLSAFADLLGVSPSVCQLDDSRTRQPERYLEALQHSAAVTAEMLHGVLWMLDPTHIILDCRYAQPFQEEYIAAVKDALTRRFAGTGRALPQLLNAPQQISSVLRGAVHVLQREWVDRILS